MKILGVNLLRARGVRRIFWGKNKFGFWFGMNLIPRRLGFYIDFPNLRNYRFVNIYDTERLIKREQAS